MSTKANPAGGVEETRSWTRSTIVIVEDTAAHRQLLRANLGRTFNDIVDFPNAKDALDFIRANPVDLVISDYMMPQMDGVELLRRIKSEIDPDLPVIIATAFSSIENAIDVFKIGASDYVPKPYNFGELNLTIEKLLKQRRLVVENRQLRRELDALGGSVRLVGKSPALAAVLQRVRAVASSSASILITGEPGTGKDLVAREVHRLSPRAEESFVPINCAALPESLLESELFGHEKGAFTGADSAKKGLVEEAEGGTLFLDEIGTMAQPLQAKLLHLLQDGTFRRVGSTSVRKAAVRIVSATNSDLQAMVAAGTFRSDLFYRLHVVPIEVPPLRARKEDIPLLLHHFVERYSKRDGKRVVGFTSTAMKSILAHDWPGNVRELENFVERTIALAPPTTEWSDEVPLGPGPVVAPPRTTTDAFDLPADGPIGTFADEKRKMVERFEKEYLIRVLAAAEGNVTRASDLAGKNRSEFHSLLKKYELKSKDFKPER